LPQAKPKAPLIKTSVRFDLVDLCLYLLVAEAASIMHAARAGMALASASERIRLIWGWRDRNAPNAAGRNSALAVVLASRRTRPLKPSAISEGVLFFYALGGFTKTRNAQRTDGFDDRFE
jgi:hypothetical protein